MAISNYIPSSRIAQSGVCTSSTRPASPYEGQMVYETDTDMLAIWNGSAWRYIASTTPTNGTVLQVVHATHATEVSTTSTSYVTTNLTASITPKSTTSKVMALATIPIEKTTDSIFSGAYVALFRGTVAGTNLIENLLYSEKPIVSTIAMTWLDSPNTTSAQTYTVGLKTASNLVTVKSCPGGFRGSIILTEIAG